MRVYVAGGFLERDLISGYMRRLEAHGIKITEDWTAAAEDPAPGAPKKTSDADLSHEEQLKYANADLEGVATADIVWHVVAGYKGSRGAYVEVGYALACRDLLPGVKASSRRVIVSGPDWRKSIFHALADQRFFTHEEALAWLIEQRAAA